MRVDLWRKDETKPVFFNNVKRTFQIGGFFCLETTAGVIYRYPICHIFCVRETPTPPVLQLELRQIYGEIPEDVGTFTSPRI